MSRYNEPRFGRAAYFGLSLPSHSVAIVKSGSNRSARLPTQCDVCEEMISDYPYIAKNSVSGHRKYHVTCAVRIELVSLVQMMKADEVPVLAPQPSPNSP